MSKKTIKVYVPEMGLEDIDDIREFQGELKELSKERYEGLKGEILTTGFAFPLFVWRHDGVLDLMDGHQRLRVLKAMRAEGFNIPKIPVCYIDADNEKMAKRRLFQCVSVYGKVTGQGLYEQMIAAGISTSEIEKCFAIPEINIPSFNEEFFGDHTVPPGAGNEDSIPENVDPKVRSGDLYILGDHRLLCGDATKIDDIKKLMGSDLADMVWTDPPYNVAYEGKTKAALKIQNDEMDQEKFYQFLYDAFSNAFMSCHPGSSIYIAHADSEGLNFRRAMVESGWLMKQCLIWMKQTLVMGRQDYHWKHEPILYGWSPGAAHNWFADRKQTTILEFDRPSRSSEHPTMKPVELIEYCIGNSCKKKGIVLDLFGGSGSTMIAAEKMKRRAFLSELDPRYCDVIIARWEDYSGKKAELVTS